MDEPKRRGRPPKIMAQPLDRLASLTNREKALALKVRARHRYTFDMPLDLYERLLIEAESWDQPLPDVVRACLRSGLDVIKKFSGAQNPYIYGQLNPPAQHDVDPSGLGWPPTVEPVHIQQPTWQEMPMRYASPKLPPGALPNGATVNLGTHPQEPSRQVDPFGDDHDTE